MELDRENVRVTHEYTSTKSVQNAFARASHLRLIQKPIYVIFWVLPLLFVLAGVATVVSGSLSGIALVVFGCAVGAGSVALTHLTILRALWRQLPLGERVGVGFGNTALEVRTRKTSSTFSYSLVTGLQPRYGVLFLHFTNGSALMFPASLFSSSEIEEIDSKIVEYRSAHS